MGQSTALAKKLNPQRKVKKKFYTFDTTYTIIIICTVVKLFVFVALITGDFISTSSLQYSI